MRRLGAELGVEAMALCRYAEGKDALLDGLVEALHLDLEQRLGAGPDPEAGPEWRIGLHRIARATYDVCLAHPDAVPLLTTRMPAVPLARRPLAVLRDHERVLVLLRRAGLDDARAAAAFEAVTAWILGYASAELRAMVRQPRRARSGVPAGPAPYAGRDALLDSFPDPNKGDQEFEQ
jgi:AcrR family transcriptional regulator